MSAVLKVENLNVTLTYRKASKKLVEDVSFEVHPGECLGSWGVRKRKKHDCKIHPGSVR